MEKFKKIVRLIILGTIILYSGYLIGYWTKYYVVQYKSNPERIYKQDTFGGKTPQETYKMFVSALRLSDFELASKYFVLSKQGEKLKEFQELRTKGELQKYIDGLPEWGEMEERERIENNLKEFKYYFYREARTDYLPDGKGGKIKVDSPAREYASSIIFKLNTATNIWKIDVL